MLMKADLGGRGGQANAENADEGGRGGQAIADDCWRGGEGGVWKPPKLADVICGQPLSVALLTKETALTEQKIFRFWEILSWVFEDWDLAFISEDCVFLLKYSESNYKLSKWQRTLVKTPVP